jgi:hypothetical protein
MNGTRRVNLLRYLPAVVIATAGVVALPVATIWLLERAGHIRSPALSAVLGAGLSLAVAAGGSTLWLRHQGSRDLLFGELLIWGWLRRVLMERRLRDITALLPRLQSEIPSEQQIELLKKLASALEAPDPYTHGHTSRVARHAYMIAKGMHLPADEVKRVHTAAAVHDVGKLRVPLEILNKPGKLTDEEFAAIKEHSAVGAEMVSEVGDAELTAMVRHHHERLDGRGYPDGLSGTDIPLGARIIAVADTFDAITSTRSYRSACKHKKAIDILKKEAGTQLDPDAVHAFLAYYTGKGTRTWWALLTTAPQRLGSWLANLLARTGTITNAIAAGGTAVALAATPIVAGAQQKPAAALERPATATVADSGASKDHDAHGAEKGSGDRRADVRDKKKLRSGGTKHSDRADKPGPGDDKPGSGGTEPPGDGSDPGDPPPPDGGGGSPPPDDSGGPVDDIIDTGEDVIDDTTDGVDDAVDDVDDTVDDVTGGVGDLLDDATGSVDDVLPSLP